MALTAMPETVARAPGGDYVGRMSDTPAFLDGGRPPVPDVVVPRAVTPFFLPRQPVRGRLVRLGPLAEALLTRHDNAPVVTRLAGQALALAAGLAAALKFRGSFSLQAKGDGPVPQLLADCTEAGELRVLRPHATPTGWPPCWRTTPRPAADELLGAGYLAFTVDQGPDLESAPGHRRHRGGDPGGRWRCTISASSEQLRYFVHLACEPGPEGWRAGALILEKIAGAGGIDPSLDEAAQEESWITATTLAGTLTELRAAG